MVPGLRQQALVKAMSDFRLWITPVHTCVHNLPCDRPALPGVCHLPAMIGARDGIRTRTTFVQGGLRLAIHVHAMLSSPVNAL